MNQATNNFKLGLFVLGGLSLLIAGILVLGASRYFAPKTLFETYVAGEVDGLAIGSAVELRGVQVGRVTHIDFSWNEYTETQPSYVVLEFEMRDDVLPLPVGQARSDMIRAAVDRGLRARVKAKGITGTAILSVEYLNPDENPPARFPWAPKHAYIPSAPGQFVELLASIEKSLHNLERLDFGTINQLLETDLKSTGRVLEKLNQVDLSTIHQLLAADLKSTGRVLEKLNQVDLAALDKNTNSLVLELRSTNTKIQSLIEEINGTVRTLKPGLANFDFADLNQTLVGSRKAIKDLDDALVELKRYPSGFLFGRPPQPLNKSEPAGTNTRN